MRDPIVRNSNIHRLIEAAAAICSTAAKKGITWVCHEVRVRRDIARLAAVDDHLLADMNIDRRRIGSAVRHGRPDDAGATKSQRVATTSVSPVSGNSSRLREYHFVSRQGIRTDLAA